MTADFNPIVDAKLSIQRALLGEVSPQLRAVVFSIEAQSVNIRFYFDGEISEEDKESVSCIETEILADYDPEDVVTANSIRIDSPDPINDEGVYVYKRREHS
jgi:hypothetical protein